MAFSCQHNNISRLSMVDGISDGLLPVDDLHILACGPSDSDFNVINNSLWILVSGIIGCDNGQVRQVSGNLSHLVSADLGTVSSTAEKAYQPIGFIFFQSGEKTFQTHGVMGVIDHQ